MAKRTRAAGGRKKAAKTAAAKTSAAKKGIAKKAARKAARKATAKKAAKKVVAKPAARKKAPARKPLARKAAAKKAVGRKALAKKAPAKKATARKAAGKKATLRKAAGKQAPVATKAARPRRSARPAPIRGAIPSSLNVASSSSAARSGREDLVGKLQAQGNSEIGPAITGGDLDANWEVAYSSGDEAPGGDNPTPDQDVVDEIGHALGIEYEANEELKGAAKLEERDRHRWELDPASAEDYPDHDK
jgi:hypothetical protein